MPHVTSHDQAARRCLGVHQLSGQLLLFLLPELELALTNLVQSFPGIFFGVLGALMGRVLMIYVFIPVARCAGSLVGTQDSQAPPDRHVHAPFTAWRPVMVLSGLRGALSLALVQEPARCAHATIC
jgi:NhaP-type Na+/H+ or K+/H+ antiporter